MSGYQVLRTRFPGNPDIGTIIRYPAGDIGKIPDNGTRTARLSEPEAVTQESRWWPAAAPPGSVGGPHGTRSVVLRMLPEISMEPLGFTFKLTPPGPGRRGPGRH